MFPEEYRSTLLRLVETDEDMRALLGLFHLLKSYTTEETLVRNFTAMTGKDCKDLLKVLVRDEILKVGANNEYLCLSGYESFFDEIAGRYSPPLGDLSRYFETALGDGDKAALKMIELLLKIGKHGIPGFTQYELIKTYISEMFSPAIFQSLEEDLLRERLCIYGKRGEAEFLELYQSDDRINELKERLRAWKTDQLPEMPVIELLEKEIAELVANARSGIRARRAELAERAGMSEKELEETRGYFSGFSIDEDSLFVTGNMIVDRDTLYVAITDRLSQYDAREWKNYPMVFILDRVPKWIRKVPSVFKDAYPKLSDRRIAIVVPHEAAYANFKQKLLSELVSRLGVSEISEIPNLGIEYRGPTVPSDSPLKEKVNPGEFLY
jgi:hypothetical protein